MQLENPVDVIESIVVRTIGKNASDKLFDGVLKMEDFIRFIRFQYYTGEFLLLDAPNPSYAHSKDLKNRFQSNYTDAINVMKTDEIQKFSYSWLAVKDTKSINRSVTRHVETMVSQKFTPTIPSILSESKKNVVSPWRPLNELKRYYASSNDIKKNGLPISKTYFYQAITFQYLDHCEDWYTWIIKTRTFYDEIIAWYQDYHRFIRNYMLNQFDEKWQTEEHEELMHYIAQAINLVALEDTNKFGLVYDYAASPDCGILPKDTHQCAVFDYRFSMLPPIFYNSVTPMSMMDHCPDQEIQNIFYKLTQKIGLPSNVIRVPSPVLKAKDYIPYFQKASPEERSIEEFRYSCILLLAQIVLLCLRTGEYRISFNEFRFARFIHQEYNVFDLYRERMKNDAPDDFSEQTLKNIRAMGTWMTPDEDKLK